MEFKLKLWKTEISNTDLYSNILKNISSPCNASIMDLFEIRKDLCRRLDKEQYKKLHQNLFRTAKNKLWENDPTFLQTKSYYESERNLLNALSKLYDNWFVSYEEYIFMLQNNLSWSKYLDKLFEIIDENNSRLYHIRLENQTYFSKKVTDTIIWLPEILENTNMLSVHINSHPENKKFDINLFCKYIYYNCKNFEKKHKFKPKYIFSITHLGLLFQRYWFDIYNLDDKISKRTWSYAGILNAKIYEQKPEQWSDDEREKYLASLPNLQKMQSKFTHKDIKFGIMDYDKFMKLAENILWIS